MRQKTVLVASGAVFSAVAVAHLVRVLLGSEVVLDGWPVPQAVSALAVLVAGALAALNFAAARRA